MKLAARASSGGFRSIASTSAFAFPAPILSGTIYLPDGFATEDEDTSTEGRSDLSRPALRKLRPSP